MADRKRFERIAGSLDQAPDLEHVFLADCAPADVGLADDPRLHALRRAHRLPHRRRSSTEAIAEDDHRGDLLHAQARPAGPRAPSPPTGTWSPTSRTRCTTRWPGRWPGGAALPDARCGPERLAVHLAAVPRVGVPLDARGGTRSPGSSSSCPRAASRPETALELIQEHRVTVWATVPTMVWRVCEHPDRHDYDTSLGEVVAFGGSPSADELQRMIHETFPNVSSTRRTPTDSPRRHPSPP